MSTSNMINEKDVAAIINKNDDILLISHRRTDGDTCGSCGALCLAIRKLGKRAFVLKNTETTYRNRILMEKFTADEDFEPQLVISVDVADEKLLSPEAQMYADRIDICIDHHASNSLYAKNTYLEPEAAATGELIVKICDALGAEIDAEMGQLIYIAISTDSGCFKYSSTTANTLRAAARCYDSGANLAPINKKYFDTKSIKRTKLEGYIYDNLKFFYNKQMVIAVLTKKIITDICATSDDMDGLSALPGQIEGVKLALTLIENKNGGFRMSARSSDAVNCSDFCAKFGGGGHKNASGASFSGNDPGHIVSCLVQAGREFFDV